MRTSAKIRDIARQVNTVTSMVNSLYQALLDDNDNRKETADKVGAAMDVIEGVENCFWLAARLVEQFEGD